MAANTWVQGRAVMLNNYSSLTGAQTMTVLLNVSTEESLVYCAPISHNIMAFGNKAVTVYADAAVNTLVKYWVTTGDGDDKYWGCQKQSASLYEYANLGNGNNFAVSSVNGYTEFDVSDGSKGYTNLLLLQGDGTLVLGNAADRIYVAAKKVLPGQIVTQNIFVNNFDPIKVGFNAQGQKIFTGGGDTIDLSMFSTLKLESATIVDDALVLKLGESFLINVGVPTPFGASAGSDSNYQMFTPELRLYGIGHTIELMGGIKAATDMGAITFFGSWGEIG